MKWKRVLLKLSGEALAGPKKTGFDEDTVKEVARQVKNISGCRCRDRNRHRRRQFLERPHQHGHRPDQGRPDRNAGHGDELHLRIGDIPQHRHGDGDLYALCLRRHDGTVFQRPANRCLKEGKIVFFAGGTGHPYFSTDTGITLRAVEMDADCILLAKSIDGVYDSDPRINPAAVKYDTVSIEEVIAKKLAVVDLTASIMCMEHRMPMAVFDLNEKDGIANAMQGKINGTIVTV